jgi:hypothetical protein
MGGKAAAAANAPTAGAMAKPTFPPISPLGLDPALRVDTQRPQFRPDAVKGARALEINRLAKLSEVEGQGAMDRSGMDTRFGRFIAENPLDDGTMQLLEVMGLKRGEDFDDIGVSPRLGGWTLADLQDQTHYFAPKDALQNPLRVRFQPTEGSGGFYLPKDIYPRQIPEDVGYYSDAGDEIMGTLIAEAPERAMGVVRTKDGQYLVLPNNRFVPVPESKSAMAVKEPLPVGKKKPLHRLPTSPQERKELVDPAYPNIVGIEQMVEQLVKEATAPAATAAPPPVVDPFFARPSLPFAEDEIAGLSKWNLSKGFTKQ